MIRSSRLVSTWHISAYAYRGRLLGSRSRGGSVRSDSRSTFAARLPLDCHSIAARLPLDALRMLDVCIFVFSICSIAVGIAVGGVAVFYRAALHEDAIIEDHDAVVTNDDMHRILQRVTERAS
jgi:hypothetical protein